MIILGFPIYALNTKYQQNSAGAAPTEPAGVVQEHEPSQGGAPSAETGRNPDGDAGAGAEGDEKPR